MTAGTERHLAAATDGLGGGGRKGATTGARR